MDLNNIFVLIYIPLAKTKMQNVQFAREMKATAYESASLEEYAQICKYGAGYEFIPDDRPVKLYLDVDVKCDYDGEDINVYLNGDCPAVKNDIKMVLQKMLGDEYKEDQIGWGSSHGVVADKFKISYHVILNNIIAYKYAQRIIVDELNRTAPLICDDMEQYYPNGMFDESVYKPNNQIIRSPYTAKTNKTFEGERPIQIESGTFAMSCISSGIPEDAIELVREKPVAKSATSPSASVGCPSPDSSQIIEKGMHLLKPYAGSGQYENWTKVIWAIKNVTGDKQLAETFSRLDMTAFDETSFNNIWDNAETRDDGVGMPTLINLMMKTDKEATKQILRDVERANIREQGLAQLQNIVINTPPCYYIHSRDIEDPYIVAYTISKTLKSRLVLSREKWYIVDKSNLWKCVKEPYIQVVEEIRKYLDYSNLKCVEEMQGLPEGPQRTALTTMSTVYIRSYINITHGNYMSNISKLLRGMLCDDDLISKLDMNPEKLAFKNGIMDLKTRQFRNGILSSDFITETIPFDYKPECEIKKDFVKSVLLKILNNNKEHVEYYLSLIGFSFIGKPHLQKAMYFCIDNTLQANGDNGKTLFFDILLSLFPNYVYKTKAVFLECDNKKVHKQLALMKGKRLVWMDEFSKKALNVELMKELADGKTIENEVMFGTSERIQILFKLFGLSNNMIRIPVDENAVYNRYKQISYGSNFNRNGERKVENPSRLEFIADETLSDKLKEEYGNAIASIIIDYAYQFLQTCKVPEEPKQFKNDAKEAKLKNDEFKCWFSENCITTGRVALKHIVKESGMPEKEVKEGMKRLGYKYNKDLRKIGQDEYGNHYKGGYDGCSIIVHTGDTDIESDIESDIDEGSDT